MASRVLALSGLEAVEVLRGIASETRFRILSLLSSGDMNIGELAEALQLAQPTVTRHINVLEAAGLVRGEISSGIQGQQKRCHLCYDRLNVVFQPPQVSSVKIEEVEMPVGLYSIACAEPHCGLANSTEVIGWFDDAQVFYHPERASAQLLWMAAGYVEYVFPNVVPATSTIEKIELGMELCSEAIGYCNDYPSDITVWINGVEIGSWTSPGDMGGQRGKLNPDWWNDGATQYGFLKTWSVDAAGTNVDGVSVSKYTLTDLALLPQRTITARIGIKPDAANKGGFNLFGRGFGNYEQGIILRIHHAVEGGLDGEKGEGI